MRFFLLLGGSFKVWPWDYGNDTKFNSSPKKKPHTPKVCGFNRVIFLFCWKLLKTITMSWVYGHVLGVPMQENSMLNPSKLHKDFHRIARQSFFFNLCEQAELNFEIEKITPKLSDSGSK